MAVRLSRWGTIITDKGDMVVADPARGARCRLRLLSLSAFGYSEAGASGRILRKKPYNRLNIKGKKRFFGILCVYLRCIVAPGSLAKALYDPRRSAPERGKTV